MILWGVWWSVKLVLQTGMQKSLFCVRPWSLLTILNFSKRGPTDKRYFNVSTPSSRRDSYNCFTMFLQLFALIIDWMMTKMCFDYALFLDKITQIKVDFKQKYFDYFPKDFCFTLLQMHRSKLPWKHSFVTVRKRIILMLLNLLC